MSSSIASAEPKIGPLLFFLDASQGSCQWLLWEAQSQKIRTYFSTPECPNHVVWDLQGKRTLYDSKEMLYALLWKPSATPVALGDLSGPAEALWINDKTAHIRKASLMEIKSNDLNGADGKRFFSYKGQAYEVSDMPEEGIPMMAMVEELGEDGHWKPITVEATSTGTEGTLGLRAVDSEMRPHKNSVVLKDLLRSEACALQRCDGSALHASQKTRTHLESLFPGMQAGEQMAYRPMTATTGILFKTAIGDTLHAAPPVFYCTQRCAEAQPLREIHHDQLAISIRQGYALVTEEYSGKGALVYGPTSQQPLLDQPTSQSAAWLPLPEVWSLSY